MTKERNHALDLAKMLAALGVVSLHVKYSTYAGGLINQIAWPTCVPFFYVASLVFFIKKLPVQTSRETFLKLLNRIVIPYLCWTAIYLSLLHFKSWLIHKPRIVEWIGPVLYGESSVHLYFIPTLLCYQLIAWSCHVLVRGGEGVKTGAVWGVAGLVVGIGYLAIGDIQNRFGCATTGNFAAAILYLGTSLLIARPDFGVGERRWQLILGVGLWVTAVGLNIAGIVMPFLGFPLVLPIGGIGFFLIFNSFRLRLPRFWWPVVTTSFGIYLSHVVLLEGFEFCLEKAHRGETSYPLWLKSSVTLTVFISALLCTLALRRIRIARVCLLGEA